MNSSEIKNLIEAAIFTADKPLSISRIKSQALAGIKVTTSTILSIIDELKSDYAKRGVNLVEVNTGFRFQANEKVSEHLAQVTKEKPVKYSRAILETLSLIAYKQPITRSEIEDIRGVAVSSHIMKTLQEREWIKTVGHKEVPGRPALYATTGQFLDYFSLKSLKQLPQLMPVADSTIKEGAMQDIIADQITLKNEAET